jgi:hypothetical protein
MLVSVEKRALLGAGCSRTELTCTLQHPVTLRHNNQLPTHKERRFSISFTDSQCLPSEQHCRRGERRTLYQSWFLEVEPVQYWLPSMSSHTRPDHAEAQLDFR